MSGKRRNPDDVVIHVSMYDVGGLRALLMSTIKDVERQRARLYDVKDAPDFYDDYLGQLNRCLDAINKAIAPTYYPEAQA